MRVNEVAMSVGVCGRRTTILWLQSLRVTSLVIHPHKMRHHKLMVAGLLRWPLGTSEVAGMGDWKAV